MTASQQTSVETLVNAKDGLVSRDIFLSQEIFDMEIENLFTRAWLFVGHETQIPNPGDYFVSQMGGDSVILTRDDQGAIHVLLNTCRHRGMKVSRYDEGNTMEFYCPFHGWSYSIDGSLVSTPGELYGVPRYETSYAARLDKSQWGLVNAPQVANYKGMVFATWDAKAPTFDEYLGDFRHWIDNLTDGLDGRVGTSEVFHGVQKWRVKANWKFVAENFLGDTYHAGPSHASVEQVGIGPGGRGRMRTGQRRDVVFRGSSTSFVHLGHGACDSLDRDNPYSYDAFDDPQLQDYFKQQWEAKSALIERHERPAGARGPATLFPNMSFHAWWMPRTILVAQPIGPSETEMWRWFLIDKDAPEFVRDWLRHYSMRYSGPSGLVEQDDMENWDYATAASKGPVARRYDYNYSMAIGQVQDSEQLRGAVESTVAPTEENARNYYRHWARMTDGTDWSEIMADTR